MISTILEINKNDWKRRFTGSLLLGRNNSIFSQNLKIKKKPGTFCKSKQIMRNKTQKSCFTFVCKMFQHGSKKTR